MRVFAKDPRRQIKIEKLLSQVTEWQHNECRSIYDKCEIKWNGVCSIRGQTETHLITIRAISDDIVCFVGEKKDAGKIKPTGVWALTVMVEGIGNQEKTQKKFYWPSQTYWLLYNIWRNVHDADQIKMVT